MKCLFRWATAIAIAGATVACDGPGNAAGNFTGPSVNSNATSAADTASLQAQTASACGLSVTQDGDKTVISTGSPPPPGAPPPTTTTGGGQGEGPVTSGPNAGASQEGAQVILVGQVDRVGGGCPSVTLTLGGIAVRTSAATSFAGRSCVSIKSSDRVGAVGTNHADGSVTASCVAGL
jgi:Domain of unknown function (DUF5666)